MSELLNILLNLPLVAIFFFLAGFCFYLGGLVCCKLTGRSLFMVDVTNNNNTNFINYHSCTGVTSDKQFN